jgi:hypothetical protein
MDTHRRTAFDVGKMLVAALFGVVFAIKAPPALAGCQRDSECKGDRMCEDGQCVDPKPPAGNTSDSRGGHTVTRTAPDAASARFAGSSDDDAYEVYATTAGSHCTTPCSLRLRPGVETITVSGKNSFSQTLVIPAGGGSYELRGYQPGWLWTGIGVDVAAAGLLLGGGLTVNHNAGGGIAMLLVGIALAATGTVFWFLGARPDIKSMDDSEAQSHGPRMAKGSWLNALSAGGWRF